MGSKHTSVIISLICHVLNENMELSHFDPKRLDGDVSFWKKIEISTLNYKSVEHKNFKIPFIWRCSTVDVHVRVLI